MNAKYRDFAIALGMPQDKYQNDIKEIKAYVKKQLRSESCKDKPFVLIFAGCNAISYKILKSYFPTDLNPNLQQIIITSQQIHFIPDDDDKNFLIDSFTADEAIAFLTDKSDITEQEAVEIAKRCNNLPFNLQAAKLYIKTNHISAGNYLKLRDDEESSEQQLKKAEINLMRNNGFYDKTDETALKAYIQTLVKSFLKNKNSLPLLKACSFFDSNNIPMPLLKYRLSKNSGLGENPTEIEFGEFLESLRNNNLMCDLLLDSSPNKISIHSVAHKKIKSQIKGNKGSEKEILKSMLGYFDKGSEGWSDDQINTVPLFSDPKHKMMILEYMLNQLNGYISEEEAERKGEEETKPIIFALYNRQPELAKLLIENGADVNEMDGFGTTVFGTAVTQNYPEVAKLLVEKGANIKKACKHYILEEASFRGYLDIVKLLAEECTDINYEYGAGADALIGASSSGNLEMVKLIIENGANVNYLDRNGKSALMSASANGYIEIAKLLIEKGADIAEALASAVRRCDEYGHSEIMRMLIENGANIDEAEDEYRKTALMCASEKGHIEIVKLLLEKGADVNKADKSGNTALMLTKNYRYPQIEKLLRENGAKE